MEKVLADAESRMKKSVAVLSSNYATIRVGRASPAVLDKIRVDYYGAPTAINQLAAVSVSEARTLTIQPWDASICKAVERAIETSDLGINPQSDGKIIRLTFPPLSEERRRDLVKEIAKMAEEGKVAVRSIRRDTMEKLKGMKKKSELTEDDLKQAEKETQDLTDRYCKEIDRVFEDKKRDIMEI
ncbi:MAG TPA: ribosome recycling factor [Ruminococcaceae bacterium]|jgi:ribosome recycling factor|nr:ribosome recycling factor [Oscillospiraceae bacterium]HBG55592.1 ribosome recycling factor [Oscillospiraceae bacterium]HBQ47040.1 ribosome recycling factor [Oscillospiraceae bacterium]HBT91553.1 ribosome recycling factor [Oscillospiraceae bacterium]HCB91236.1 ribosome recycling factor [Oscillospiraceae bacterium]